MGRPNRKGITVKCGHCEAEFKAWPSMRAKYCCTDCFYEHMISQRKERFWKKVHKTDGCWLWKGAIGPTGYGFASDGLAHRVSWEMANGEIPATMQVLHKCDVRNCVRPDHLFLGTNADNRADSVTKRRHAHGETSGKAKLTAQQVAEIKQRLTSEPRSSIAADYGVCYATITAIAIGKRWKHLG